MKVLLFNGSPHKDGCVFTALSEVAETLAKNGIDYEFFWLGTEPVRGCIACGKCRDEKNQGCVFKEELYIQFIKKMKNSDGLIVGSPVYYAGPNGSLCAFLDRVCFSCKSVLVDKPAACVVNCRRGGASAAFDRLNKYFTINSMPVISSQYWNSTHGFTPDDVRRDLEGLQTMRTLGNNMAHFLKMREKADLALPEREEWTPTNFIS